MGRDVSEGRDVSDISLAVIKNNPVILDSRYAVAYRAILAARLSSGAANG